MCLGKSTARVETNTEARVMRTGSVPEETVIGKDRRIFDFGFWASVVSASHVTSAHFSADFSVNHRTSSDKKEEYWTSVGGSLIRGIIITV